MKQQPMPLELRKSMRSVKNILIIKAQSAGYLDINEWIERMQDDFNQQLTKKDAQYTNMQKFYVEQTDENVILHAFINSLNLGDKWLEFKESQRPGIDVKDILNASKGV